MRRSIGVLFLGIVIGSLMLPVPVDAGRYVTAILPVLNTDISTWTGGSIYNTLFPGRHTWNGVPFILENRLKYANAKVFAEGTLTIPVNVRGVAKVYSIINSAWGEFGATIGKIEFVGSGTAYYKVDLIEGINVRDHYNGNFNNIIDGIHAVPAFIPGPGEGRLDMQIYTLPSSFARETLKEIVFTGYESPDYSGAPFIAAVTVEAHAPPKGTVLLLLE